MSGENPEKVYLHKGNSTFLFVVVLGLYFVYSVDVGEFKAVFSKNRKRLGCTPQVKVKGRSGTQFYVARNGCESYEAILVDT
jgi:hypothetical protein